MLTVVRSVLLAASLLTIAACDDSKPSTTTEQAPSRFNAPKKAQASQAATSFCEKTWPAGEGAKVFTPPAEKPLPNGSSASAFVAGKGWTWVNLWATWCRPCVEEMALLDTWQKSLQKDGLPLALELYSVDDDTNDLAGWLKKGTTPGTVRWLKGGAGDLPAVLESLGVEKNSPIPVHALVDGNGNLRCARVGSVHTEDYAAIKSIIAGG